MSVHFDKQGDRPVRLTADERIERKRHENIKNLLGIERLDGDCFADLDVAAEFIIIRQPGKFTEFFKRFTAQIFELPHVAFVSKVGKSQRINRFTVHRGSDGDFFQRSNDVFGLEIIFPDIGFVKNDFHIFCRMGNKSLIECIHSSFN